MRFVFRVIIGVIVFIGFIIIMKVKGFEVVFFGFIIFNFSLKRRFWLEFLEGGW